MNLKKEKNESEMQYIWRLASAKDVGTLDMTWKELGEVFNENLGTDYDASAYRKRFQSALQFYDDVFSKMDGETYSQNLMEQKREIERLKVQLRDERNAWNKQNYTDARVEQKLDYLEEQLRKMGKINFPEHEPVNITSDNDMLVILSDLHIGLTFNSAWGKYDSDIATRRMEEFAEKIRKIAGRHKSENLFVAIAGDLVSGSIHKSIAITNREDVIEQIKIASKLINSFCAYLSKYFSHVYITNVAGNHSRIDKKEDALHSERLDDLIGWIVKNTLAHIDNITFIGNKLDNGIAEMNIRGKKYLAVHGDFDPFSKNGVEKLVMMVGYIPDTVLFGHKHCCSLDECNGIKMIRGGSLCGSGDQYTIEKRINGKPAQMVCICSEDGVDCCYPVELK